MASKLSQDLAVVGKISPQLVDANTVVSDDVPMSKNDKVMFILTVGATDITVDAKLRESQAGSNRQDITGKAITQVGAGGDNTIYILEIDGEELSDAYTHCNLSVTVGDGSTGAYVSCVAIGGHLRYGIAADNDLAAVTQIVG